MSVEFFTIYAYIAVAAVGAAAFQALCWSGYRRATQVRRERPVVGGALREAA